MSDLKNIILKDIQQFHVEKSYRVGMLEQEKLQAEIAALLKQAEMFDAQIAKIKGETNG